MGIFSKLRGEFIDIIEWVDDSQDTLVHRFERHNNEIKYGAKLVVREGQEAVFVDEGKLADVFPPGTYTLETANIPILSTLQGWKHGFESPFKAEVYFVKTTQFTDQKWGTKNPIMLRDPEFGPMRLRAFGTYAFKAGDPAALIREVVGTDGHFSSGDLSDQLRNLIVSRFTDVLAESKLAALDLAANYNELGEFVRERIEEEFNGYGIDITSMLVENISLPPEVEEILDKRTGMGIVGDLGAYTQFQAAQAMEKAAEAPNSGAGQGMGMGMGFAMANQM
ncbi:MAG: SPFH domain-containing protein, partial [Rubricoccaceae bacterium]|nr:SPFH domain-containing protein [Rubricoccaceae bacterium]